MEDQSYVESIAHGVMYLIGPILKRVVRTPWKVIIYIGYPLLSPLSLGLGTKSLSLAVARDPLRRCLLWAGKAYTFYITFDLDIW